MARKRTRNTRGRIIAAAWKLFYEQGYENTTVEEIIEASSTSKGSFYHYFEGKTPCFPASPICSTKSIRNWKPSWTRTGTGLRACCS